MEKVVEPEVEKVVPEDYAELTSDEEQPHEAHTSDDSDDSDDGEESGQSDEYEDALEE